MEPRSEMPKLPDMVMCGDHPSFTKTELNTKDIKEEKKETTPLSFAKVGATTSRAERAGAGERRRATSAPSDHALRADARRRPLDAPRSDAAPGNGALVTAALGSFRWPPYLLAVWVLVLVLTHALHCLVSCMERALPCLRQLCQYFRTWAEESWRAETDPKRMVPVALALVTGLFYALYFSLYLLYAVALWSIEPLYNEEAKTSQFNARILPSNGQTQYSQEGSETRVTDYVESTKSDASIK